MLFLMRKPNSKLALWPGPQLETLHPKLSTVNRNSTLNRNRNRNPNSNPTPPPKSNPYEACAECSNQGYVWVHLDINSVSQRVRDRLCVCVLNRERVSTHDACRACIVSFGPRMLVDTRCSY